MECTDYGNAGMTLTEQGMISDEDPTEVVGQLVEAAQLLAKSKAVPSLPSTFLYSLTESPS